jgi:hypothetical protein
MVVVNGCIAASTAGGGANASIMKSRNLSKLNVHFPSGDQHSYK